MKSMTIELDPSEIRVLKRFASRQIRTPENLARYFIVRGLGLVDDNQMYQESKNPLADSIVQTERLTGLQSVNHSSAQAKRGQP